MPFTFCILRGFKIHGPLPKLKRKKEVFLYKDGEG